MDGVDLVCLSLSFLLSEYKESQIINILDLPAMLNVYGCLPLEICHFLCIEKFAKCLDQSDQNCPHSQKAPASRLKTNSLPLLPFHLTLVVISADLSCTLPSYHCRFPTRWMAGRTAGIAIHHTCLWMIKAMSEAPISVACIQQHSPLCHPQRIREPERFSTYFRMLLTAHLLRSKSGNKDEMNSEKEMKKPE